MPRGPCQLLWLYHQFFGLGSPGAEDMAAHARMIEDEAGRHGYELEFLLALVPDPADSQMPAAFDQALDAIQQGLAQDHFLLDRNWLPWAGTAADAKLYRRSPGLVLFRRPQVADRPARLLGVFLVGETPKLGIHKAAFRQALRLIADLRGEGGAGGKRIRILGPTYSGSGESLRLALQDARRELGGAIAAGFRIVTGSATACGLENLLTRDAPGTVELYRTVLPDDLLRARALDQLRDKMGWDLRRLALITESDTAYGQGVDPGPPVPPHARPRPAPSPMRLGSRPRRAQPVFAANVRVAVAASSGLGAGQQPARSCAPETAEGLEDSLVLGFPSHISAIRSAREAAAPRQAAARPEEIAASPPKTDLDLSLASQGSGADLVQEFSPLTAADTEEAVANLLETISREGIRYVGILATDVRDKLFLAERVRRFSPDIVLFTLDGDLLFAHRQVQGSTNGMIVISTFSLFTEGGAWLHGFNPAWITRGAGDDRTRRQFTSELEQGIFHAVEALLHEGPLPDAGEQQDDDPQGKKLLGWISVASNGYLWPVLNVEIKRTDLRGAKVLAYADPDGSDDSDGAARPEKGNGLSERADLELLLFAALLCGLSCWLRQEALVERPRARVERAVAWTCGLLQRAHLRRLGSWLRRKVLGERPRAEPRVERYVAGTRGLLGFGLALVALTGSSLVALHSLSCFTLSGLPGFKGHTDPYPVPALSGQALAAFLLLLAAYLFQVGCLAVSALPLAARTGPWSGRRRLAWMLGWLAAAGGALALVELATLRWFIPGEAEYFHLRARVLSSGLSPIVSLGWLMVSSFVWVLLELKRRRLIAWQEVRWPVPDAWDPTLCHCSVVTDRLGRLIGATAPRAGGFWLGAAAVVVPALYLVLHVQPVGETRAYARFFLSLVLLSLLLGGASFYRFWQVWQNLQQVLLRIEQTPLAARFAGLQQEVGWKPMRSFGWQIPRFKTLLLSTERLRELVRCGRVPLLDGSPDSCLERLSRLVAGAFAADCDGSREQEIRSRRKLRRLLHSAGQGFARAQRDADHDDFLALRTVAYLRYVFAHLRNSLMAALFPGLLLLFAVSSYAFEPKGLLSMGFFGALLLAIAMTFCVFVAINRNPVLNLIAGVEPGEVSLDRAFFTNLLTYAVVPLLGVVAILVPEAGQLFNGAKPLLRIIGIG